MLLRSLNCWHYYFGGGFLGLSVFVAFAWREKCKYQKLAKTADGEKQANANDQS